MEKLIISDLQHLFHLRKLYLDGKKLDSKVIEIYTSYLKYKGVLRFLFKYCSVLSSKGSVIRIYDNTKIDYGQGYGQIYFWRVRSEFFKVFKASSFQLLSLKNESGFIEVKKIKETNELNGYSIGIVFSGNINERKFLINQIDSIDNIKKDKDEKFEVVISLPNNTDLSFLNQNLIKRNNIRFINFNLDDSDRIMITKKKNHLIKNLKYDIMIIAHSRILFSSEIFKGLKKKNFDIVTTKVLADFNGKIHPYLDYLLIPSYCSHRSLKKHTIHSFSIKPNNFFKFFKHHVPYIDGGLTIINKSFVINRYYNEDISWGEAEDVELCANMYLNGACIDYFSNISCYSQTNKMKNVNFGLKLKLRILLNKIRYFSFWS